MANRNRAFCAALLVAFSLSGCAGTREAICSKKATAITSEQAIDIAVKAVHIKDRGAYKLELTEEQGDYVGYLVYYEAKNEGSIPSFGTVAVDFCGKVLGISRPL